MYVYNTHGLQYFVQCTIYNYYKIVYLDVMLRIRSVCEEKFLPTTLVLIMSRLFVCLSCTYYFV